MELSKYDPSTRDARDGTDLAVKTGFQSLIGLEIHIQLNTQTKIFCACSTDSWNSPPNTHICPVCTGQPGALPVLNQQVVEKAVKLATVFGAEVQHWSFFDRKNYFYPDLPKGYQITQYTHPLAIGGFINLQNSEGVYIPIFIQKIHIEEDAAKTRYRDKNRLIDYNRCGVPLVEVVTIPQPLTASQAASTVESLQKIVRWIDISNGDLERGNLRCDVNVSIRPQGANHQNPKTEIKNLNSLTGLRTAIELEIKRQVNMVSSGKKIDAWTLEWDQDTQALHKMRLKENEAEYRFFREPDLLPIEIDTSWLYVIQSTIPELPDARRNRFVKKYQITNREADLLTSERELADTFEETIRHYSGGPRQVAKWIINDVQRMLKDQKITAGESNIKPKYLAQIIQMVDDGTVNLTTGRNLFKKVLASGKPPLEIVSIEALSQITDIHTIRTLCDRTIADFPDQATAFRAGNTGLLSWFTGQVMDLSERKAKPQLVQKVLLEQLIKG